MNLKKVEKKEKNIVELEVQIDQEQFEAAINKAYQRNVGKINVPGFRKGKAPRKIIEKMYGPSVFYEDAINFAYPEAYEKAVEEASIEPVGHPDIEITDVSPAGFSFKAKVTVIPEVNLAKYKGLTAQKIKPVVTDEEIDAEIDRLKKRNARINPVERPVQNGDIAIVDFEGFVDGKPFEGGKGEKHNLTIGSGQFIPGFEEQLIGVSSGEEKDVEVTFPEEYHAGELAGKKAVFKCKVNEVKETIEPEVDDEFAKDVSEFDTIEDLKNSISKNILERHNRESESAFEEALLDKLLEGFEAEIPAVMIENQIDKIIEDMNYRLSLQGMNFETYVNMTGSSVEQIRASFKERAERQVKAGLSLAKVAQLESVEITDDQVKQEFDKMAERYNMPIEKLKEMVPEDAVKKDLTSERAMQIIKESSVVEETETTEVKPEKAKEKSAAAPKKPRAKPRKKESGASVTEEEKKEKE